MNCPRCGSENFRKSGLLKSGKQRYICKECGKGFSSSEPVVEVKKHCIYCGSENTVKAGRTRWNKQIYLCNDCKRKFNENRAEVIEATCPICGGELRYKGWSNNGHARRFICVQCGKGFSGEDPNNLKVRVIEHPCPYCGSENVRKGGRLKSGAKRYYCNDCNKGYNENTIVVEKEPKPEKCPKCGGTHINRSGHDTKTKKQRYKCVDCGYKFVENPTQPTFKRWKKSCPRCGHTEARKAGRSNGKQYYQCLNCNHKYLEGGVIRHCTKKDKEEIKLMFEKGISKQVIADTMQLSVKKIYNILKKEGLIVISSNTPKGELRQKLKDLILSGYDISDLSKKSGYSCDTLQSIVRYDYLNETISNEQLKDIVKYGVGASVPVKYLAPYIKCSVKKCKQVLSKYTIKPRKKYQRTETEKHQDWFELDKFIMR